MTTQRRAFESRGWIGVDLDGTLALYKDGQGLDNIGPPIDLMAQRVRNWLAIGHNVRIFTARIYPLALVEVTENLDGILSTDRENFARGQVKLIREWCQQNFNQILPVTCQKDFLMAQLWDDRCVQIHPNTGIRADGHP
jgi:hypothetical protein